MPGDARRRDGSGSCHLRERGADLWCARFLDCLGPEPSDDGHTLQRGRDRSSCVAATRLLPALLDQILENAARMLQQRRHADALTSARDVLADLPEPEPEVDHGLEAGADTEESGTLTRSRPCLGGFLLLPRLLPREPLVVLLDRSEVLRAFLAAVLLPILLPHLEPGARRGQVRDEGLEVVDGLLQRLGPRRRRALVAPGPRRLPVPEVL